MSLSKSGDFISDVERQFEWYVTTASWEVGELYLDAVEATCHLLNAHPLLGPPLRATHPRLQTWRFMVMFRPFQRHLLFYEVRDTDVILRRAMHGHRNLPRRLLEPPSALQ
jgi:plasmid stabilization system protein ParE